MCEIGVIAEKLQVCPHEVLVLKAPRALTPEESKRFQEQWKREYPNIKALLLANDIEVTKVMVDA